MLGKKEHFYIRRVLISSVIRFGLGGVTLLQCYCLSLIILNLFHSCDRVNNYTHLITALLTLINFLADVTKLQSHVPLALLHRP